MTDIVDFTKKLQSGDISSLLENLGSWPDIQKARAEIDALPVKEKAALISAIKDLSRLFKKKQQELEQQGQAMREEIHSLQTSANACNAYIQGSMTQGKTKNE